MKKPLFIICNILFVTMLFCFMQCKKDNQHVGLTMTLYDKPLDTIKAYIQGKWKLIYGKGGIATTTQYYDNKFWEFNNDKIKIVSSGSIVVDTTINWNYNIGTYTNGDSTFLMNFYDSYGYPSVYDVDRIYNDTLILHDNSSDAYFYHFIKSN